MARVSPRQARRGFAGLRSASRLLAVAGMDFAHDEKKKKPSPFERIVDAGDSARSKASTVGSVASSAAELAPFSSAGGVASNVGGAAGLAGKILAPFQILKGVQDFKKAKDPGSKMVAATTAGSGAVGTLAALGVLGPAAVAVGGGAALGTAVGDFGNNAYKDLGILGKDDQGKDRSLSDYGADKMGDLHDWVEDKTGSDLLGHLAAFGGLAAALPFIPSLAVTGAIAGGGKKLIDLFDDGGPGPADMVANFGAAMDEDRPDSNPDVVESRIRAGYPARIDPVRDAMIEANRRAGVSTDHLLDPEEDRQYLLKLKLMNGENPFAHYED